jgi:hypothetical protein
METLKKDSDKKATEARMMFTEEISRVCMLVLILVCNVQSPHRARMSVFSINMHA